MWAHFGLVKNWQDAANTPGFVPGILIQSGKSPRKHFQWIIHEVDTTPANRLKIEMYDVEAYLSDKNSNANIKYREEKGRINVSYIPTTDMVADGLTKPLKRVAFGRFRELLGITMKITTK